MKDAIELVGYACGIGAGNTQCQDGPLAMQASPYLIDQPIHWYEILKPIEDSQGLKALDSIAEISSRLAQITSHLTHQKKFFITVGGDHTSAIGTWSGVANALSPDALGLLWIDAHLDSHTFQTTPSGNIHGMPLAALLGEGHPALTDIMHFRPKLLPENVCILGIRSFEGAEKRFLEKLKVRIFYMEEIAQRGFETIFTEAISLVSAHSKSFGISLDLDAINPQEAPGVGSPVPSGISLSCLVKALDEFIADPRFIAAEIAEFNPSLDQNEKTEKIVAQLLHQFSKKVM